MKDNKQKGNPFVLSDASGTVDFLREQEARKEKEQGADKETDRIEVVDPKMIYEVIDSCREVLEKAYKTLDHTADVMRLVMLSLGVLLVGTAANLAGLAYWLHALNA